MLIRAIVFMTVLTLLFGCRQEPTNSPSPSKVESQPTEAQVSIQDQVSIQEIEQQPLPCEGFETWTLEDAVAKLAEANDQLCAAIRLIQLAGDPNFLLQPEQLSDLYARFKLMSLSEEYYAFGLSEAGHDRHLRAPWKIAATGEVEKLSDPNETVLMRVSADVEVFPHLLITDQRVLDPVADPKLFLVLMPNQKVCFRLAYDGVWPYVALVMQNDPAVEVARYRWMPFEQTFHGPAYDNLPNPVDGTFRIDLKGSDGLEPVGGKIPPPIQPIDPEDQDILPI